jgi:hypothetical protein
MNPHDGPLPVLGYHWPDLTPVLRHVGGNECGLDLEHHGPCAMELERRDVNYFACPLVVGMRHRLNPVEPLIRFERGGGSLAEWQRKARS